MNNIKKNLENQANFYKRLYLDGEIDINTTINMVMPYINLINNERCKISKAYGQYLPNLTFEKFMKNT